MILALASFIFFSILSLMIEFMIGAVTLFSLLIMSLTSLLTLDSFLLLSEAAIAAEARSLRRVVW